MALSAAFTVNGVANPAKHTASYGTTATLALTSVTGATSIVWTIMGCSDPTYVLPALTLSGSPQGAVATFPLGSDLGDGLGRCFLVRCAVSNQVRGADGAYEQAIQYAVVGVVNGAGRLPIAPGEENYRNGTHGYGPEINELLAATSGGGSGSGNVVGPASATTGRLASYADSTGKLIADSGLLAADVIRRTGTVAFTADQSMGGHKLTSLATPTNSTDAVTKAYADSLSSSGALKTDGSNAMAADLDLGGNQAGNAGDAVAATDLVTLQQAQALIAAAVSSIADWKQSVRAATTGGITLSGAQTIDGVSVVSGDRVLVKNQSTAGQNGIYVAAVGAWSRATDADTSGEVTSGMTCVVEEGTLNGSKVFILTTPAPIALGTTGLTFSAIGTLSADGTTISLSGTTLSVATGGITNTHINSAAAIAGTKISPDFGSQNITTTGYTSFGSGTRAGVGSGLRLPAAVTAYFRNNANSADLRLYGVGDDGADFVNFGDNTYGVEWSEVASGRIVLGLCVRGKLNSTMMPAGSGSGVIYVAPCATAPSSGAPGSNGVELWADGGALYAKSPSHPTGGGRMLVGNTSFSRFVLPETSVETSATTLQTLATFDTSALPLECSGWLDVLVSCADASSYPAQKISIPFSIRAGTLQNNGDGSTTNAQGTTKIAYASPALSVVVTPAATTNYRWTVNWNIEFSSHTNAE